MSSQPSNYLINFSSSPSKSAVTISIKVILDLVALGTEENKYRVREDPIVDAVGISLLTENCCFNGVESTSKPTELHNVFFV